MKYSTPIHNPTIVARARARNRQHTSVEAGLVADFVWLLFPGAKRIERFFAHHLDHGDFALRVGLGNFLVDEGVIETSFRGIGCSRGKINAIEARPVNGAQAHGARFAACVNFATLEVEFFEFFAGLADRGHFGVGGGIVCGGYAVGGLRDNLSIFYNQRTEGTTSARLYVLECKRNGALHESVFGHSR
jgi:hypothetical protein